MKNSINEGIQGNVVADMVVIGRGSRATKSVHSQGDQGAVHHLVSAGSFNHQVFLSYRRADSAGIVGRIYDRLVGEFGPDGVFKDVDSIPFGVNFRRYVADIIRKCTAILVVIGRDWLIAQDASGARRLDDSGDLVRIEIESALRHKLVVVPLLVNGAAMPQACELPVSLHPLTLFNGMAVRVDPDFHTDMSRLLNRLSSPAERTE